MFFLNARAGNMQQLQHVPCAIQVCYQLMGNRDKGYTSRNSQPVLHTVD